MTNHPIEPTRTTETDSRLSYIDFKEDEYKIGGLLNRIFYLGLSLEEAETLTRKIDVLTDELCRILSRKVVCAVAFDNQFNLLAASISSAKEKDHLAFELHLSESPERKRFFYNYLQSLKAFTVEGGIYVDNERLHAALKEQVDAIHPLIEFKKQDASRHVSTPELLMHQLFSTAHSPEAIGAYWVKCSQDGSILFVLYLGSGSKVVAETIEEVEKINKAVSFLTAQLIRRFENYEIRRLAIQDNIALRASFQLTSELVQSSAKVQAAKEIDEKLYLVCKAIVEQRLSDCAVALLLNNEEEIVECNLCILNGDSAVMHDALRPLKSAKKISRGFWEKLQSISEIISESFVTPDLLLFELENNLQNTILSETITRLGHRRTEVSITFFTPLYNQERKLIGFIAYSHDDVPIIVNELVKAVEWFARIIEKDIQLTFQKNSSVTEFRKRREQAQQTANINLQDAISFSRSLSTLAKKNEKVEAVLKAICQKGAIRYCAALLFGEDGEIKRMSFSDSEGLLIPTDQMQTRLFHNEKTLSRFVVEAIVSCRGFELSGNYCFTIDQVKRLMNSLESGGGIPPEFQSPETIKDNLLRLGSDREMILITPIRYRGEFVGYILHGEFKDTIESAPLSAFQRAESFALISFFARELARELSYADLIERNKFDLQQSELMKDITDSLVESAKQLQTVMSAEHKAAFVAEALTERFGFQSAGVVFYEKGKILSATFRMHSQAYDESKQKHFEKRFQKGFPIPEKALNTVFLPPFQVGLFYAYQTSDLRKMNRMDLRANTLSESFGTAALKDYVSGSDRVSLMLPIYDERKKRIGHIVLGQLMLFNLGEEAISLTERMKLVTVLVEQLSLAMRGFLANREKDLLNENLLRSEARYRNLVENVNYGCIIFDSKGEIEFVNTAMKSLLGFSMEELRGKRLEQFAESSQMENVRQLQESVYAGKAQSDVEIVLVSNKGEAIPFQTSSVPHLIVGRTGELEIEGAFSVLVDLRPQYEIEKKKRQLETIKNNFYAMVVHDMKVPLAAIFGYSEMLKESDPAQMNSSHFQDIMNQIYRSSVNITNLIQEILEFSKYESHAVTLDRQMNDIRFCVEMVVDQNSFALHNKQIEVEKQYEPLGYFMFDLERVSRVVGNILSNAIKFSHKNGKVIISLSQIEQSGVPYMRCSIKDFGEGIPETELDNIFDAYRQAQSKHGSRGTGLGLSISKQIVELHGGYIWAESKLGEGAMLIFTLPMLIK